MSASEFSTSAARLERQRHNSANIIKRESMLHKTPKKQHLFRSEAAARVGMKLKIIR
jgi:hypothetical protein